MVATPARTTSKRRTRLGSGGRLVIPAEIRQELGLKEGDRLVMRVEDGELRIMRYAEVIRRVQESMRPYIVPGKSIVDELIAERRAEVAREEAEAREAEALREQRP
jgi:AbrB family looped-hinge helix DNA binding protein